MEDNSPLQPTKRTPAEPEHSARQDTPTSVTKAGPRHTLLVAIAIATVCALTVGTLLIAHASASGSGAAQPNQLQAIRTPGIGRTRSLMLRIVVDATSVQRLYGVILKLPHIPQNAVFNCPMDDGTTWTLTFWSGTHTVARVVVNDLGCQFLFINGHDGRMTALSNFWQVFAATIALPPDQV